MACSAARVAVVAWPKMAVGCSKCVAHCCYPADLQATATVKDSEVVVVRLAGISPVRGHQATAAAGPTMVATEAYCDSPGNEHALEVHRFARA